MQPRVLGFVHDAHPATAKFFWNTVVGKSLSYQRINTGHVPHILGRSTLQFNEPTLAALAGRVALIAHRSGQRRMPQG
jgi:hypothetical protein